MSDVGKQIIAGLEEALAYAKGEQQNCKTHRIARTRRINVKALRRKLRMSQQAFAETFGLSVSAIRNWEQGKRHPAGAARALLIVIAKAPEIVRKALEEARR